MAAPRRAQRYMPIPKLNFQMFASQLNTTFQVTLTDGSTVPLKLVQARKGAAQKDAGGRSIGYERFSLLFAGPLQPVLEQQIHAFSQPRIGQFDIFIVPVISRDASATYYECIFNRPRVKSARAS